MDTDADFVLDGSLLSVGVGESVSVGDSERDATGDAVCVGDSVAVGDLESLGSEDNVANVNDADVVSDDESDHDIVNDDENDAVVVREEEASEDGEGDLVGDNESVGDSVTVGEREAEGSELNVSVGVRDDVSSGVMERDNETSHEGVLEGLTDFTVCDGSDDADEDSESVTECVFEREEEKRDAVLLWPCRCFVIVNSGIDIEGTVGEPVGIVRDGVVVTDDVADVDFEEDGIAKESEVVSEEVPDSDIESSDSEISSEFDNVDVNVNDGDGVLDTVTPDFETVGDGDSVHDGVPLRYDDEASRERDELKLYDAEFERVSEGISVTDAVGVRYCGGVRDSDMDTVGVSVPVFSCERVSELLVDKDCVKELVILSDKEIESKDIEISAELLNVGLEERLEDPLREPETSKELDFGLPERVSERLMEAS